MESKALEIGNKNFFFFSISFVFSLLITWLVKEPSFTGGQTYVLFILLFSIGLWLTEAVPPFAVGLLIIGYLVFSLGYEKFISDDKIIKIYLNTFSSSVIWLMLGGFFLAAAMTKTRLDNDLIRITLGICGSNPKRILFGMMTVTMLASMLISNTATTSMVIAAVAPLLVQLGKGSLVGKGLILGIPVAATTGGMGTLIGSPPNAVAAGDLAAVGTPINFVSWIYYGIPLSLALTFIAWWALGRIFMKDTTPLVIKAADSNASVKVPAKKRIIVILVLVTTVALWLTSPFHGLSAAAVSALPLIMLPLSGILNGQDVRAMGWDTLILVAGGLSLGIGLQQTGLLDLYAGRIASMDVSPAVFYLLLAYATMLFSNIMSNTATSTVLIPLGMAILPNNTLEIAMIIALSASTAMFLPVSTPPNAIAYSTGMIQQKDLRVGGLLIGLLGPPLIVLWVWIISGS